MNTATERELRGQTRPFRLSPHTGTYAFLLLFLGVGVVLRCHGLTERSVWFDEAFCRRATEFRFSELLPRVAQDNHPPLYFVVLKTWSLVVGDSIPALRGLSILFGCITVVATYWFMTEAYRSQDSERDTAWYAPDTLPALVAAAFVAVSVFQVRWSTEIRMYSMGTALACLSTWAMFRALHATSAVFRAWLVYCLMILLFAYTHYYAFFTIAAQALFIAGYLFVYRHDSATPQNVCWALTSFVIAIAAYVPWLPILLRQREQVQEAFWIGPVTGWKVIHYCYMMFIEPENAVLSNRLALALAVLCGLVLASTLWRRRAADMFLLVAALTPFALSIAVSACDTRIFHLHYLVFAHVFVLAALSAAICRIPYPWIKHLVWGQLVLAFIVITLRFQDRLDVSRKPGVQAAVRYLLAHRDANEPVIACSPLLYLSLIAYVDDRSGWSTCHQGNRVAHYEGAAFLRASDICSDTSVTTSLGPRVWIVDMTGWGGKHVPVPIHWSLLSETRFPEVYRFQGEILVREYRPLSKERGSRLVPASSGL